MKIIHLLLLSLFIIGCQSNDEIVEFEKKVPKKETIAPINGEVEDLIIETPNKPKPITVMVVPCSNGYDYGMYLGDLNPFLEEQLANDARIHLEPFPLKKMNGSGYHGVYDKRYCKQILETVSVDFLIMTKMIGGNGFPTLDTIPVKWGYSTKILNTQSMDQFKGISASGLDSFNEIDGDIQSKTTQLIKLIIESAEINNNVEK